MFLAAALVAAPPAPDPLAGVPSRAEVAFFAQRAGPALAAIREFLSALSRRSPLFAPSRLGADAARRLGFDPLDPKSLDAAGFDLDAPMAYFVVDRSEAVVARVRDAAALKGRLKVWLLAQPGARVSERRHKGAAVQVALRGKPERAVAAWVIARDRVVLGLGGPGDGLAAVRASLDGARKDDALAREIGEGPLRFWARTAALGGPGVAGAATAGPEGLTVDAQALSAQETLAAGPLWPAAGVASVRAHLGPGARRAIAQGLGWALSLFAPREQAMALAGRAAALARGPLLLAAPGLSFEPDPRQGRLDGYFMVAHAYVLQVGDPAAARALIAEAMSLAAKAGGGKAPTRPGTRNKYMSPGEGLHGWAPVGARGLFFGAAGDRLYLANSPAARDLALSASAAAPQPEGDLAASAALDPPRLARALGELTLLRAAAGDLYPAIYGLKLELAPLLSRTDPVTLTATRSGRGLRLLLRWPAPRP